MIKSSKLKAQSSKLRKDFPFLFILIIVGLFGVKALFHPGFYTSHDGWHNIARLYHFHKSVSEGQIPPRWSGDLANGFGYPLFFFSYHLPWILAESWLRLGFSIFDAIKIVLALGFFLSGIFMYLFVKEIFGQAAGLMAGIVYMGAPYRFLRILVAAAVGEATVFMFLPLLFWGIYRLSKKTSPVFILIGALGLAGIILSHLILLPIIAIFLLAFILCVLKQTREKKAFLKGVTLLFLLGLGLAAYYWLPLVGYSSLIKAKTEEYGFTSLYRGHFVNLSQLLYSRWGYGPIVSSAKAGEISFQIGIVQWLGFFISLGGLLLGVLPLFAKNIFKKYLKLNIRKEKKELIWLSLLIFCLTIFLMLDSSQFIWEWLRKLVVIDYPWRFLALSTFIGAILCGFSVFIFKKYRFLVMAFLLVVCWYTNRNHLRVNQYTDIPLSLYVASETTTNTFAEYLPLWARIDINKKPDTLVESEEGLSIEALKRNSWQVAFKTKAEQALTLKTNYLYFPGQTVYIDGKKTDYDYKKDGRIFIPLPKGEHQIKIIFEKTSLMKLADLITLVSLLSLVVLTHWLRSEIPRLQLRSCWRGMSAAASPTCPPKPRRRREAE